ncbi:MAG: helix-turn-helix domain-containing protein, partial [Candidatus Acidiferrum sp.]
MARGNFGERLKREREMREVSLNEVTVATRIGSRFLEALENEDWAKLPGGIFNRGFVRSIARYLGLDEENLLAEYDLARGEQGLPVPQPYENKIPRPPLWMPVVTVLAILAILAGLVAGGIYGWRRLAAYRATKRSSSTSLLPVQQSNVAATEAATAPKGASAGVSASSTVPLDIVVSSSAATRVRIVADGTLLL